MHQNEQNAAKRHFMLPIRTNIKPKCTYVLAKLDDIVHKLGTDYSPLHLSIVIDRDMW